LLKVILEGRKLSSLNQIVMLKLLVLNRFVKGKINYGG